MRNFCQRQNGINVMGKSVKWGDWLPNIDVRNSIPGRKTPAPEQPQSTPPLNGQFEKKFDPASGKRVIVPTRK